VLRLFCSPSYFRLLFEVDNPSFEDSTTTKRSFQNASPYLTTMDSIQATMTETTQAVSIPTIMAIVNGINHSDQCLHADTKIAEYISLIPSIQFHNQEERNNYSSVLFTIQEETPQNPSNSKSNLDGKIPLPSRMSSAKDRRSRKPQNVPTSSVT
ncbi:hypothetical protein NPIL_112181, partial [Nephila pilipes]